MLIPGPYLIGLFLYAIMLCSIKSQNQAIVVMLAAPFVWEGRDFAIIVLFSGASAVFGHITTPAAKR